LANPLRAISTHLPPTTPLTARGAESTHARLLAGGRSVAEGMSAKLAQTIALGSQFVDRRMLTPIVRNAAQAETDAEAKPKAGAGGVSGLSPGISVSADMAAATQLSNAAHDEALVDEMARMLLRDGEDRDVAGPETYASPRNSPLELQVQTQVQADGPKWINAPLEPTANAPQDPYENLLDEVDELLGEIKDDDEAGAISQPISELASPVAGSSKKTVQRKAANDLDFEIDDDDDDDDDDDLTRLLKD
ncbi:hypothetical protein LPJ56_004877, partial [Coemansia sp. RSA 2599]